MASHTPFSGPLTLVVVVLLFHVATNVTGAVTRAAVAATDESARREIPASEVAVPSDSLGERPEVSLAPSVTVSGATAAERQRLELALDRFGDAGLMLPDLEVVFDPTTTSCNGYRGLFQTGFLPWRVSICSEAGFVYEHELAHAWEAATLTDELREGFMVLRGFTVWSDHTLSWNERGVEDAVFIIQQGLGGLPLPPDLFDEQRSRLAAFELLTGFPDPRLTEWEAAHGGLDRPRALSGV